MGSDTPASYNVPYCGEYIAKQVHSIRTLGAQNFYLTLDFTISNANRCCKNDACSGFGNSVRRELGPISIGLGLLNKFFQFNFARSSSF